MQAYICDHHCNFQVEFLVFSFWFMKRFSHEDEFRNKKLFATEKQILWACPLSIDSSQKIHGYGTGQEIVHAEHN